ncbi:MAG TPA: hypothetical protein VHE35_24390, partial [Kofleriaceae bacterium]|nr:hypothetical protein [Kofleriaceae bacterium]
PPAPPSAPEPEPPLVDEPASPTGSGATPALAPDAPLEARIAAAPDLAGAMALARPSIEAVSAGDYPDGAELLAHARVRWSDVGVPDETTTAKVEKDPAAEQGKHLCVDGVLVYITRRKLDGRPFYVGSLTTTTGDRVTFLAAGSSGDLYKRDRARLCGVVTGATSGDTSMFGMFDLPDNRHPPVEEAP